jgi:hypothetical protein
MRKKELISLKMSLKGIPPQAAEWQIENKEAKKTRGNKD